MTKREEELEDALATAQALLKHAGKLAWAVNKLLGPKDKHGDRKINTGDIGTHFKNLEQAIEDYDYAVLQLVVDKYKDDSTNSLGSPSIQRTSRKSDSKTRR